MALRSSLLLLALGAASAVDRSKFRSCAQAGFCRRHRDVSSEPELRVVPGSVKLTAPGQLSASVHSDAMGSPLLDLNIFFYESGIARMRLTEDLPGKPPRWEVRVGLELAVEVSAALAVG